MLAKLSTSPGCSQNRIARQFTLLVSQCQWHPYI